MLPQRESRSAIYFVLGGMASFLTALTDVQIGILFLCGFTAFLTGEILLLGVELTTRLDNLLAQKK